TPALLVELDALERNIRGMQDRIAGTKLRLRPHAKTHKSTAIANLQLAAGAVGVCCQKVSEAEIMVDGGIGDVLISNEVVGAAKVSDTLDLLRRNGFECGIVSAAGTGTFEFEIASGVYDELQVGSYVFMDADYGRNEDRNGEPVSEFENSLFLLTTVMSTPAADRAIVDAGLKALSVDSGMPLLAGCDGISYAR